MPIRYERDDGRKCAVITITGPFDLSEVRTCLEQHRTQGGWEYGLLYDTRHLTGRPTTDMLREFAGTMKPQPGEPPRGPVAVVSTDSVTYVLACTYAATVKAHATFAVFRNRDEPDAWLSDRVGA